MNDPVTLPREVVEQVRGALAYVGAGNSSTNPNLAQSTCRQAIWKLDHALRAALEQPQNHVPDVGNMVQAGWKLVPVEPTEEMLRAGCGSESPAMFRESLRRETDGQKTVEMVEKIIQRNLNSYRAMLAAAPQPQTTEQSSAVEQPQGEQEPVAWIWTELSSRKLTFDGPPAVPSVRDELTKPVWTPLYTHPQPQREQLTDEQSRRIYDSATYAASLAVFMTRVDAEHPDADDKGVSGWLQEAEDRVKHRAIEAAHDIGNKG